MGGRIERRYNSVMKEREKVLMEIREQPRTQIGNQISFKKQLIFFSYNFPFYRFRKKETIRHVTLLSLVCGQ